MFQKQFIYNFKNIIFNKNIILSLDAGSDVAGLTCLAKKSECGKFYIVNGTKKWVLFVLILKDYKWYFL